MTSKLLSSRTLAVVGVKADLCSKGFFSHRNQIGCLGLVSAEVPAWDDEGFVVSDDIVYSIVLKLRVSIHGLIILLQWIMTRVITALTEVTWQSIYPSRGDAR